MTIKGGIKFDGGKDRWDLLPLRPIREIVKVFSGGATRYDPWNWAEGIGYSRVYAAAMRHINAWWGEGKTINEDDFGLHHLAHAAWCIIVLLFYELYPKRYKKFDDRFKVED